MRLLALLLAAVLALPAAAQQGKPRKPAAHTKPTPQQIRKFKELEKKDEQRKKSEVRRRSPDSRGKSLRAPSAK